MGATLNAVLGGCFLVAGIVAVVTMLRVLGQPQLPGPVKMRLFKVHRLAGRLYALLYLVLLPLMLFKARDYGAFNALQALHIALAVALLPILGVKIFIARKCGGLHNLLPPLGITAFVFGTTVVLLGLGPFVQARTPAPTIDPETATPEELVAAGRDLLERRCQKCHDLDRVYDLKGKKTAGLWRSVVARMVRLDSALENVEKPVAAYLAAEFAAPDTPAGMTLTGAALVEARCSKCHSLDRVYGPTKTKDDWRSTVERYAVLLPDHIRPDEVEPIAAFLYEKRGRKADPMDAKRAVFEAHCGACHNLSRALEPARESPRGEKGWWSIARRMNRKAEEDGVKTWTDEQGKTIAAYLASLYEEDDGG